MKGRKIRGNVLALLAVVFGFVLLILAFFVMNYNQFFGAHKEVQSAIDAAALQVAKDLSRAVVGPADGAQMGYVGLVDQVPKGNDFNQPPVIGINTLMATARLDALISHKLENTTMQVLAIHDLERVKRDARLLKTKLEAAVSGGGGLKDRNGDSIDIKGNAAAAYDNNAVRLGKAKRQGDLVISLGRLNENAGMTNIPVPQPIALAQVTPATTISVGDMTCYKPYVTVPAQVGGNTLNYMFTAVANEPTLIENANFTTAPASVDYIVPSVVQVQTDESITAVAPTAGSDKPQVMHAISSAVAGSVRQTFPSGTLQATFPMKPPPKGYVDTTSVKSIMNYSQIAIKSLPQGKSASKADAESIGGVSPYDGWNGASIGTYFQAKGGDFPNDQGSSLEQSKYRGRSSDDPSVILSFVVYDWLHHMYLRPNIESVVNALSADMWKSGMATTYNHDFMPLAIAEDSNLLPVTFGLFNVSTTGDNDPRDLRKYAEDPDAYKRQFANVFGYVAADMTLPNQSLVVSMDENSHVVTTNGQPATVLLDLWAAIANMNNVSAQSYKAAYEILNKKMSEVDGLEAEIKNGAGKQADRDKALAQAKRAFMVMVNATYAINTSLGMLNDRKPITSLGVTKYAANDFGIVGGHFYPPDRAASAADILGEKPIPNGQAASSGTNDWLTPLDSEGASGLKIIDVSAKAISQRIQTHDDLLQPALAATSVPQSNFNIFLFTVNGDVSRDLHAGLISMVKPLIDPAQVVLKNGQTMYQNTAALVTKADNTGVKEVWNCVARDNGSSASGTYFSNKQPPADSSTPGGSKIYPATLSEWSLRCPAATGNPELPQPPTPPTPPPGGEIPKTPTCQEKPIVAVHSQADFDNTKSKTTDMDFVTSQVDAAGNISYFFRGQPMHFLSGDAWLAAVQRSQPGRARNVVGQVGPLLYNRSGGANNVARWSDAQWQDWISKHDLITNKSQAAKYKGATQLGDWKYSAYSQAVFEIWDDNSCPQLYRWSS